MGTDRVGACTGICCQRFPLGGGTHEELLKRLDCLEELEQGEGAKIRDMLIVIAPDQHVPYPTYSCKHWDPSTRLCTNYEDRPIMCSAYPYDGMCKHCGMVMPLGADEHYQTVYPAPMIEPPSAILEP